MDREIHHFYIDPIDALWLTTARWVGLRVIRSGEVHASTDGAGRLHVGTRETLDPDDCLAQMIFHELCHSLIEGEASFRRPDWGLDNETDCDVVREHACLRLQAALADRFGLRGLLAPTTDFRAFYDGLGADPLAPVNDPSVEEARAALARSSAPPWAPHLERALGATSAIARIASEAGGAEPRDGARVSIWSLAQPSDRTRMTAR